DCESSPAKFCHSEILGFDASGRQVYQWRMYPHISHFYGQGKWVDHLKGEKIPIGSSPRQNLITKGNYLKVVERPFEIAGVKIKKGSLIYNDMYLRAVIVIFEDQVVWFHTMSIDP